jgi:hypothetical protein
MHSDKSGGVKLVFIAYTFPLSDAVKLVVFTCY